MSGELDADKRKAIEIDRAVRRARYWERQKQAGLGCLVFLALSVLLTLALARCPADAPRDASSALTPVHGVFIAQPLQVGARPGTATMDGWSTEQGADEQVSFTIEKGTGRMVQCQYWSKALLNHLTAENPPKDECGLRGGKDRTGGGVEVSFMIIARSLKEGRPRNVSGTLILSQPVARQLSNLLPGP